MENSDTFVKDFMRHRSALLGWLTAVTGDFHTAEDLFQEVSVIAFQKQDQFEAGTNMGAWVRAIARRKLLEHQRRAHRHGLPLDNEALDKMSLIFEETEDCWESEKEALRDCVRKLPRRSRHLIDLRYKQALPLEKISRHIKSTAGAVQVALSRIRQGLTECIRRFLAGGSA